MAAILLVGAILRFYKLDFQSIWVDEILTMKETNPARSIKQLYDDILFWEQMPHLYFFLTHFTFKIFGFTVFVGRMFSALCGVFGIFGVYLLGREFYNRQAGLVSAAIVALSGFHIAYSQEMRPYAMFFLFTVLSFYRLAIFVRNPGTRNAVLYGIFAGLMVHGHMFGLVTIAAQAIAVFIFMSLETAEERKRLFLKSVAAGFAALLVIAVDFQAVLHVLQFKAFWLAPPSASVYTDLFRELLGNSEIVVFLFHILVLAFIIAIMRHRSPALGTDIKRDGLLFPAILLLTWICITLLLPLLKSHLDVSMIISRYFIGLVAALALIAGIAIQLIGNRVVRAIVISVLLMAMFVDLTAVRKYYSTVTKSQIAELTTDIARKNPEKHKIVTFWSWLFPHFYLDDPATTVDPVSQSLDEYVDKLRTGAEPAGPFWYANANSRPFTLTPENVQYLVSNYNLVHDLSYFDAWAKHYVPKNHVPQVQSGGALSLRDFSGASVGADGKMALYSAAELKSKVMAVDPGKYTLTIRGQSSPEIPLNDENAHLTVKWNNEVIGNAYLSEKSPSEHKFTFTAKGAGKGVITIVYDNDFFQDGKDRNAILENVELKKE